MRIDYPIETLRLSLEPFQESDGDALYVMERDPEVKQYAGGVLTRRQTEKLLKKFIQSVSKTGWGAIAIKVRETNQIVGLCGFYGTDVPNEAEIFYGLARDAWGQGYATEAGKALVVAGTQQGGLSSIIAPVHPENVRSIRVLEKIGMTFSHSTTSYGLYKVAHVYCLKVEPQP
jgi:RimJ/RimL family protein N-acetyltransferase